MYQFSFATALQTAVRTELGTTELTKTSIGCEKLEGFGPVAKKTLASTDVLLNGT